MKNLLGMAKQKKQAQQQLPKQSGPALLPGKRIAYDDYFEEGEMLEEEIDEDYEPSQQEILDYAQFLGIDPVREKDLMYIAREGLLAPLPEQWKPHQTDKGEIYYINIKTGDQMWEHPCDEYYQQVVQRERAKKINKQIESKTKAKESKDMYQNRPLTVAPEIKKPKPMDPLLKLEQEKKMKRMEEQRKKELEKRKKDLDQTYQLKKDDLLRANRNREDALRNKHAKEEEELAASHRQRASEKHRSEQQNFERELEEFRRQLRESLEATYKQRLTAEKSSLEQTYRTKKEDARRALETEFKKKKKAMDEQFAEAMKELDDKERQLRSSIQFKEDNFEKEMEKLKQQYIEEKLAEKSHILDAERVKQDKLYSEQAEKLLEEHNLRVANIDKEAGPATPQISLQPFVKELEENYQKQLKVLNIELASIRQLREAELQEKLVEFEAQLQEAHRERCDKINRENGRKNKKELEKVDQEFELRVSELEKQANDDYLRSLNEFERRYEREQNSVMGHFQNERLHRKDQQSSDEQDVARLSKEIERLQEEAVKLKKHLSKVELECENSRSHLQREESEKGPLYSRLNTQQKDLYDLIGDRERLSYRRQKQQQLQVV